MKKIKSIKWCVELSYRDSFIFEKIEQAVNFIKLAAHNAEDPDDILRFELKPYIEYEEDEEQEENEDV